ncbi:hypothetical protein I4U23_027639 [Adineta vaga]|nr:hypothetical protein I4U23_027639 [Adineta vaga]
MTKVAPELILDANQLSDTIVTPQITQSPPKELPKSLADFQRYLKSKCCYYSKPIENAELISVQPKVAFKCQMKILMETRKLRTKKTPYRWDTDTVLGSHSLGRFFENTERSGEAVGDIWNDYQIRLPSGDKFCETYALTNSASYTRCSKCRGKKLISCSYCSGDGRIKILFSLCKGGGQIICSDCKGYGGFRHLPTLTVKWFTRSSTWFYQNSFLHNKRIRKGQRTLFWSAKQESWSKGSSIENFVQTIYEETLDIPLRANIIKDYNETHHIPTKNKYNAMRRIDFVVERLGFEEICYTMGENYVNKRNPTSQNMFRFCQYSTAKGQSMIYENDYPLNCCGCFGEKAACYSSCCNIQ